MLTPDQLDGSHLNRQTPNDYLRIYLFGDSLTERAFFEQDSGFGWRLREYYDERVEVVNEGYSGQTTKSLRRAFESHVLEAAEKHGDPAPLFVTIFLGANDACLIGESTYVPLVEYEEHIRHYVNSILNHPSTKGTKVILISPPPIDVPPPAGGLEEDDSDIGSVSDLLQSVAVTGRGHRTWESKRKFAQKIVEIGREFQSQTNRVLLFDFWTVITKHACQDEEGDGDTFHQLDLDEKLPGSGMPGAKKFGRRYFTDGLHLGKTAYDVLGRELLTTALKTWPQLSRENFPLRE